MIWMRDWRVFQRHFHREWMLSCRDTRQMFYACLFFLMMLIVFPLTMSTNPQLLRSIAPGLIWIDVLFAFFLSADRLFQSDYDDGVIEQWVVSGYSLYLPVMAKLVMHWCLNVLPMLMLTPLIGVLLHLTMYETIILIVSLLCGTPAMICLCALAAAFSTGIQSKGLLMAFILFPLTIPMMIFGSHTLMSAMQGMPVQGYMAVLLAFSTLAIGFLPWAIGAVVGMSLAD